MTRSVVQKPLPSVARPALLRHIGPQASSKKWPGLPRPLPLGATATTTASGGNREELLGPRPAGCERQRSRRWEPQPGQWHAAGVTERASQLRQSRYEAIGRLFCQSDTIAVQELFGSVLALSGAPRQLSQRESHWHVGQLSSGRAKPDITQKILPCYRGQQLRNHVPCQAAAGLGSRALLFPDRVSFARPAWAWPTRQRLPLWESWRTK